MIMISHETLLLAAQALQTRIDIGERTLKAGELPSGKKLLEGHKMAIQEGMNGDNKALNEIRAHLPSDSNIVTLFPK